MLIAPPSTATRRPSGFTLIELMIVMVVVAVLAGLAWPSFQSAIRKSRRADGIAALTQLMQAQERYRTNNSAFGTTLTAIGTSASSREGYYTVALVGTPTSTGYVAKVTAASASVQAGDSPCRVMTVTVDRGQITYSSANASGDANATDPCWPK